MLMSIRVTNKLASEKWDIPNLVEGGSTEKEKGVETLINMYQSQ